MVDTANLTSSVANGDRANGKALPSVAQALVTVLEALGVREAFGVSGGAMATLWGVLSNSPLIQVLHCRHEGGAAFAAAEAYFACDRPMVTFTTAGPGITNALTGLWAARDEGAKVIHLSACTSAPQRGRWAIQETSDYIWFRRRMGGVPTSDLHLRLRLFSYWPHQSRLRAKKVPFLGLKRGSGWGTNST